MQFFRFFIFSAIFTLTVPGRADVIGVYRDWTAVTVKDGSSRTCMIWSQPRQSMGHKGNRGDVFAFVTHLPQEKRLNRVSFEAGIQLGTEVRVIVDGIDFSLSAAGTGAWARTVGDDLALIGAMRAGKSMTVEVKPREGGVVRDRYSLFGFTAAYSAINAACNVR